MSLTVAILAVFSLVVGIMVGTWVGFRFHRRSLVEYWKTFELFRGAWVKSSPPALAPQTLEHPKGLSAPECYTRHYSPYRLNRPCYLMFLSRT